MMKGLLGLINILNLVAKPTHIIKKAKKILKRGHKAGKYSIFINKLKQ